MGPGPIYSVGQKQRVLEPYSLSLSSMVAAAISQNPYLVGGTQVSIFDIFPIFLN